MYGFPDTKIVCGISAVCQNHTNALLRMEIVVSKPSRLDPVPIETGLWVLNWSDWFHFVLQLSLTVFFNLREIIFVVKDKVLQALKLNLPSFLFGVYSHDQTLLFEDFLTDSFQ